MYNKLVCFTSAVLVFGLLTTVSYGQLSGLYEFDAGGDGTSWDDAANWEQKFDPFGAVISGDPATPPDAVTSADIPLLGVVLIDNTQPGQTALDASIGTAAGAGSLSVSGGGLLAGRDVFVGRDPGGFNVGLLSINSGTLDAGDDITLGAGSVGVMVMSGGAVSAGDDFFINANSSLTMTGGTINVGDRLITNDNAGLVLNGGAIVADDDFFFFGNSQITVNSGSMVVKDKMRFDGDDTKNGKLTINGGFVRSDEFHFNISDPLTDFRGIVEINGDGFYDVQNKANLSNLDVATAKLLIAQGTHLITSDPGPKYLSAIAITLGVGEFFGNTDPLSFTRILLVPEPASVLLLGLGGLGLLRWRRKKA